jgi:trans-aconitate methyltransferase
MEKKININTKEYWNKRFESTNGRTDWEVCNGCNQSKNFMKTMINSLPPKIIGSLKKSKVLDVGCALGDGTNYLKNRYNNINITGYDFSINAVLLAKLKYPEINFIIELEENKFYDYVLMNNILQCVDDFEDFLKQYTTITKKGIIVMVPFGEEGASNEHFNVFISNTLPKEINNFYQRKSILVNTENWAYKQLVTRYERMI